MHLNRIKNIEVKQDNVHRWLVSYADYMTLLFALFVVLYAMAMVNEKPFDKISESFSGIFQDEALSHKQRVVTDSLISSQNKLNNQKKPVELDDELRQLKITQVDISPILSSNVKGLLGNDLSELETQLTNTLEKLLETNFVKLKINNGWLEIELSSGLLFPSGSSFATTSAKVILSEIYSVIIDSNNFIRIRGYTDNQIINNEIFSSNWELSVFRATAILKELEIQGINPARMAIEGYGQYYPISDNETPDGRTKNRRVVIALSKYGLQNDKPYIENEAVIKQPVDIAKDTVNNLKSSDRIKVIKLDNGAIRVTTRNK